MDIVTLDFRYKTEIMCLAARIISAIGDRARKNSMGNANGVFNAIHIRSKFDFGSSCAHKGIYQFIFIRMITFLSIVVQEVISSSNSLRP